MPEIMTAVSITASVCAIICGIVALFRNKKKDDTDDGRSYGQMMTELGYIKANTDEIKEEQKKQRDINTTLYSRMTAVEESTKQAHKRIDRIEMTHPPGED